MGVGAGLYMYVVVVQKFTFAISSPDEFLLHTRDRLHVLALNCLHSDDIMHGTTKLYFLTKNVGQCPA